MAYNRYIRHHSNGFFVDKESVNIPEKHVIIIYGFNNSYDIDLETEKEK